MGDDTVLRVAVIGVGTIGEYHLRGYAAIPGVQVLGAADTAEYRLKCLADAYHVPQACTDYHELLQRPEIDAVSICLPNCLHAPVTIEALQAGKHVLVEKPMATTAQEAQSMVDSARQSGKMLAVSVNYRWSYGPDSWYLKHLIDRGKLGAVYYIRSVSLRRRTFLRGHRPWHSDRKLSGGGALIDMGPHMLDLAMWLGSDYSPIQVSGVVRTALMVDTNVDDFASAVIRMKSGLTIALESTWESFTRPALAVTVFGTSGGAILDILAPQGKRLTLLGADDDTLLEATPLDIRLPTHPEATVQEHFAKSIVTGCELQNSAEHGLAVMRVLDAVYRSSETGRDVVIEG